MQDARDMHEVNVGTQMTHCWNMQLHTVQADILSMFTHLQSPDCTNDQKLHKRASEEHLLGVDRNTGIHPSGGSHPSAWT